MCWTPLCEISTNNVNKTWALLQTIGGIDDANIFYAKIVTDITTLNLERCSGGCMAAAAAAAGGGGGLVGCNYD
jgi:hypothetical protein